MRIDCEQCGAAFNIDDALISDRGVRAQCPKCGKQKVVKKTAPVADPFAALGAGAPNPFAAAAAPAVNPFAAAGDGPTASGAPNPFAAAPTVPSANPFASAQPTVPTANPFGAAQPTVPSANPFAAAQPTMPNASPFAVPSQPGHPFSGATPALVTAVHKPVGFGAPPDAPVASPFGGAPAVNPFGAQASAGEGSPFSAASPFASPDAPFANTGEPFLPQPSGAVPSPVAAPSFGPPGGAIGLDTSEVPIAPAPDPFAGIDLDAPPAPTPPRPAPPSDPFAALGAEPPPRPAMGGGQAAPSPRAAASAPPDDPFATLDLGTGPRVADQPASTNWQVKTKAGMDAELDLHTLREMLKNGTVASTDEAAPLGQPLKPIHQWPLLTPQAAPAAHVPVRAAGARASAGGRGLPRAALLAIPAVLIAAAVALVIVKPELLEGRSEAGVNPLRRAKPTWAKQFPDVSGTATDHLNAGREQMKLDTAAGYRKADEELRQALLVDIGNISAMSAWVENLTNLPAVRADVEQAVLAEEVLTFALKKEPTSPDVLRADAALKLVKGDIDGAQKALEGVTRSAPNDVAAFVLLARSHLDREAQDALDTLETQVKPKAPDLKSALVVEGAAHRRLGNFKEARDALNARLAGDPQNTGALKETAKLELDLGNPEEAIAALTRLIQAEERDVDAHLMRAKIAYQSDGLADGLKRADAFLTEILTKYEASAGELLLPALAHAAHVKAELGDLERAQSLAERARATDPNYAPALFVLGRVTRLRGDLAASRAALEASVRAVQARDSFWEPAVRAELALTQAASGDMPNAIRNFEQVIEYDPRDTRAHFGLASTYMKNGKPTQAMTIMRRALHNDPAHQAERRVLTDYPTAAHALKNVADTFRDATVPADDPSLAALKIAAEGTIRYHAGERAEAKRLFEDALREDRFNHGALFHLGVMALEDGLPAEAKRKLGLAVQTTGKGHAMTQLYMARAELAADEPEAAKKRVTDLLAEEPSLVQAQYTLAMVLRALRQQPQALELLKKVVKADPDYTPAKRALVQ